MCIRDRAGAGARPSTAPERAPLQRRPFSTPRSRTCSTGGAIRWPCALPGSSAWCRRPRPGWAATSTWLRGA
eukprot:3461622-Alexandrium_andersonii.AAC.1